MLFLAKYQSNLIVHGFCSPSHNNGGSRKYALLYFHYFISLETGNNQKSEVFLLEISLGNVNASVVTWRYFQIYNVSFRKEFLETLCKCIYLGF